MGAPMSAARPRRDEGTAPNATGRKALSRKGSPVIAEIFFWILLSSVEAPGLGGLQPIRTPTPETEGFYPQLQCRERLVSNSLRWHCIEWIPPFSWPTGLLWASVAGGGVGPSSTISPRLPPLGIPTDC